MKYLMKKLQTSLILGFLVVPAVVSAQLEIPEHTDYGLSPDRGLGGADGTLNRMIVFFVQFIGLLAILMIVTGGVLYMTAGGDSDRVDRAKKWIQYGVGGFVIALLAYTIVYAISFGLGAG